MKSAPKKRTSVARKTHMPKVVVSRCCSSVANCSRNARAAESNKAKFLLHALVIVCRPRHLRGHFKIVLGRRGGRFPFQARGPPGIRGRRFTVTPGPQQIQKRHDVADAEYGRAGSGKHV